MSMRSISEIEDFLRTKTDSELAKVAVPSETEILAAVAKANEELQRASGIVYGKAVPGSGQRYT